MRLQRLAAMWQGAPRPTEIVTPGPGQESVWDYPRPPRIERLHKRILVQHAGRIVADTRRALRVVETASPPSYYIPPEDVVWDHLLPANGNSFCEWKGQAQYLHVQVGNKFARRAAWSYASPFEEYADLCDHVAFYAQRIDVCSVDGTRVEPQPGQMCGGWVTPEIVGPFRGSHGGR